MNLFILKFDFYLSKLYLPGIKVLKQFIQIFNIKLYYIKY